VEVWLLKNDNGFVELGDKNENMQIPVFPEEDFAKLFITDEWLNCTAHKINIEDFIKWLVDLSKGNINIAGFPSKNFTSVIVTAEEMRNHIIYEMQQYE
jgi:hypothetical protein